MVLVEVLRDPVVESRGHRWNSDYVETYWLPILGPTATWLVRLLARDLERQHTGVVIDLADVAARLGVSWSADGSSTLGRAIARCQMFGAVDVAVRSAVLRVRSHMAPLPQRHLARLPASLRARHEIDQREHLG